MSETIDLCFHCGAEAVLRCAGCRGAMYCSRAHQKEHWNLHRSVCKPYEAKSSTELGRYLVANRDLEAGDLVLTEAPLVFGPKSLPNPEFSMPCVGCYRPIPTEVGERCNKCGWPICSGNCPGLSDPLHHGLECIVLSLRPECAVNNMADYYRHDALLLLRCLLMQHKAPKKWKKLLEMQSHMADRTPDTDIYRETDDYIVKYLTNNFLHALRSVETHLNTKVIPDISPELLHKICGIIDVNALEIRLNSGAELLGLYPNTCLIEHNCVPNTKHIFDLENEDPDNLFKITVKIVTPVNKDDHITTMYSHALWGTQARRQHLKETKFFSCICQRCRDPTELGTYLSAMKCLGDGIVPCNGIHLPADPLDEDTEWACSECTNKVKNVEVNFIIGQIGEEVDTIQMSNPSVEQLEHLLVKLDTLLHPHHYHVYSVKHSLIQLYGHQKGYLPTELSEEMLQKKVEVCKELVDITAKLDPGNARLSLYTAVIHNELQSALVWIVKKKQDQNQIKRNEIKVLLGEAYASIVKALDALKDDIAETSGKQLYSVIKQSEVDFNTFCKVIKVFVN